MTIDTATSRAAVTASESANSPAPDSARETVESIVVALILAFVFRAFVVEAFVIPTGSMAPTLYGAHGTVLCEDCGWEFAYGLKDPSDHRTSRPVSAGARALCPNCAHVNTNLKTNDNKRNAESGDRILVLKWPFDIGGSLLGPARWDVAVFKNPADGVQNYIKRIAGLPNEVLMILDGDVFAVPTAELSTAALAELEDRRREKYRLRAEQEQRDGGKARLRTQDQRQERYRFHREPRRGGVLRHVSEAVLSELDKKLTIARKTPVAQEALWFVVYNHDYPPRTLDPNQPRWATPGGQSSCWDTSGRRVRFQATDDDPHYIELMGKSIRAAYAYNILPRRVSARVPPVSDQRVQFVLTPATTGGALHIRLVKARRTFWASIRMDGLVTIAESRNVPSRITPVILKEQLAAFMPGESVEISFEHVDYRMTLSVDGREVLATSSDRNDPGFYGPDLRELRRSSVPAAAPPRVYGERGSFELAHLVVERDVYYFRTSNPTTWCHDGGWGTAGNPILLRSGEYFMLGDNSPASQDSRLWGGIQANKHLVGRGEAFQLGTVPADQLIGKAFYVYWPSAHRLKWLPLPRNWGIVPDVGRMRWIR